MERLSLKEVSEVARLASQRHAFMFGRGSSSHEVGVALGLNTDEIERLLHEVRGQGDPSSLSPSAKGIKIGLGALAASLLVAGLGVLAFGLFGRGGDSKGAAGAPVASVAPTQASTPTAFVPPTTQRAVAQLNGSVPGEAAQTIVQGAPPVTADYLTSETQQQIAVDRFHVSAKPHIAEVVSAR